MPPLQRCYGAPLETPGRPGDGLALIALFLTSPHLSSTARHDGPRCSNHRIASLFKQLVQSSPAAKISTSHHAKRPTPCRAVIFFYQCSVIWLLRGVTEFDK